MAYSAFKHTPEQGMGQKGGRVRRDPYAAKRLFPIRITSSVGTTFRVPIFLRHLRFTPFAWKKTLNLVSETTPQKTEIVGAKGERNILGRRRRTGASGASPIRWCGISSAYQNTRTRTPAQTAQTKRTKQTKQNE